MISKNILPLFFIIYTYISTCLAQLGTEINLPLTNSTVKPGEVVKIDYTYQNMGNGVYTVNIDLWQDQTLSVRSLSIASNVSVKPGNSTGTQLPLYLNATYDNWKVPHGLNETVYLTVTTKPQLSFSNVTLTMRSRAIVLHVNAGRKLFLPSLSPTSLLGLAIMLFGFNRFI
ncbi:uncharacterized protein BX663DRAFT_502576 [Cokeromyces recurvatus]|uniref:uncharacterized protein n=1 Tax=Cokeromyces recurvatus TaxID=90255 RepID=UPI002221123A|nr:uncharacterized protein BX663DRAFT_502576 [Cokeromyces recurvatus]KAI7904492.1 hypothetical protein BX663DRAFT_502576 [Cokeromyces recurvatus]